MQKTFNKLILSLILPVLLLIVWQLSASQVQNAAVLPTIGRVLENFVHATDNFIGLGSIPRNIGVSLKSKLGEKKHLPSQRYRLPPDFCRMPAIGTI